MTKDLAVQDEEIALTESNRVETPIDVVETPEKKCAAIGEFVSNFLFLFKILKTSSILSCT